MAIMLERFAWTIHYYLLPAAYEAKQHAGRCGPHSSAVAPIGVASNYGCHGLHLIDST